MTTQQKQDLFQQVFGEPPTGSMTDQAFLERLAEAAEGKFSQAEISTREPKVATIKVYVDRIPEFQS